MDSSALAGVAGVDLGEQPGAKRTSKLAAAKTAAAQAPRKLMWLKAFLTARGAYWVAGRWAGEAKLGKLGMGEFMRCGCGKKGGIPAMCGDGRVTRRHWIERTREYWNIPGQDSYDRLKAWCFNDLYQFIRTSITKAWLGDLTESLFVIC